MDQTILKQLQEINRKLTNVLTKDDAKDFTTKNDLKNFATKDDLKELKADLIEEIKESEAFIVGSTDRNKAERRELEDLRRRVTTLERKIAS